MPFEFKNTQIDGVVLIVPRLFSDHRGDFAELYQSSVFSRIGIDGALKQVNFSRSKKHVIRALHYQLPPKAQGKLVQVSRGKAFDVAVDIRKNSSTFGKWVGEQLSADEKNMLYVPPGFAHGFCALEEGTELIYYCTDEYSPEHERGIVWNDPAIGIAWPVKDPVISERDADFPSLKDAQIPQE